MLPIFMGSKSIFCFTNFKADFTLVTRRFYMSCLNVFKCIRFPFRCFPTVNAHPVAPISFSYL